MKYDTVVCLKCGAILQSKHVHDMVVCECPNKTMVDGGREYHRIGGKSLSYVKSVLTMAEAKRLSSLIFKHPKGHHA